MTKMPLTALCVLVVVGCLAVIAGLVPGCTQHACETVIIETIEQEPDYSTEVLTWL